jgi:hypothetical protein
MGIYKWKEGARFSADAEKVAEELLGLPERTAEAALEFAEDEATELHKCATWDDSKAAHLYRLDEMRRVIRSVVTIDESPDREPLEYRAFEYVIVTPEDQKPVRMFSETRSVLADPDTRKQVLAEIRDAISELSAKAKTYRYLAEQELSAAQHHLELAREAVTV